MSDYAESKRELDKIRTRYGCKGEIILRTAIQYVVEYGQNTLTNLEFLNGAMENIQKRHDQAKSEGKFLFMTRELELSILQCANELAKVDPYDFLIYVQREIYLGGTGISYHRAMELLRACAESICVDHIENSNYALNDLRGCGFSDAELEEIGCGYLLDLEEKEDNE